ncbi:MAG: UDP-N-acetylglucosamine--N-acetylmuramyl-(pentapeptide) pyrophosphoryl-undecaprenol N-acetylglucosamine transferase [Clostridia bacterium BRH_c25]|nr:MAG: UDP-N-acetylglucosamine--N-acetylmuramyl-(pentapeptide) pyrophosphoryl-undecaprenol N-acetylglucosamine transferase [Clostridia bacterium BRH_c25]
MRVILSGGGTGGHIYPAVSIAKEIKRHYQNAEILFIGTERGLENSIVPKEGFKLLKIKVRGFKRKLSLGNVAAVKESFAGLFVVSRIIRDFKPDIVIGTGGYVCGSVLLAAAFLKVPTLIHEQNAFPGVTNKILARLVDVIAVNFPEAQKYFPGNKKVIVTGNPIRGDILSISKEEGLKEFGFSKELPLVFVVGGSRGARKLNESVLQLAKQCITKKSFQMLHMTGETQYDGIIKQYGREGIAMDRKYLQVRPYLHNMPYALAASDIIISRCGASTLSEITALGKPSILIPFPYATGNHQEYNGRALEKNGAAVVILERDLNADILYSIAADILNKPEKANLMRIKSKELGRTDAAFVIVKAAEGLVHKRGV